MTANKLKLSVGTLIMLFSNIVWAGQVDQARSLFISLTGASPTKSQLDAVVAKLQSLGPEEAADYITRTHKEFLMVQVKKLATPWTSKDSSKVAPLSDMMGMIIGVVRDDIEFNRIFYDDLLYIGDGCLLKSGTSSDPNCNNVGNLRFYTEDPLIANDPQIGTYYDVNTKTVGLNFFKLVKQDSYIRNSAGNILPATQLLHTDNRHFEYLDQQGVDLSNPLLFKRISQMPSLITKANAVAGIYSTRGFAQAYYQAGTNRAPVAYTMQHFLCKSMEELNDTTVVDFRNRRDVDRSPGGIGSTYKSFCVGCHAGMDGLAGAFAYYDFKSGQLMYAKDDWKDADGRSTVVAPKMNQNGNVFPEGYFTSDDSWINLWTQGNNASLGWGSRTNGYGAREFGEMIAHTEQFPQCMAEQVFKVVCYKKATDAQEVYNVKEIAKRFKEDNYNMRNLFVNLSVACMGE